MSDLPAHRVQALSSVREDLGPPRASDPLDFRVIGVGGGGCNIVHRVHSEGEEVGDLWALNTDAQHLYTVKANHKLLLGRNLCRGRSANADPKVGELAAEEVRLELAEKLKGVRLAFLLAGLGGGTGSGSTPVVAKVARELHTTTVALVTQPFTVEGSVRAQNARASLERLRAHADFVSVFPNDRLLADHPGLSFRDALEKADEAVFSPVRSLYLTARAADLPHVRRRLRRSGPAGASSAIATRQRGYAHAVEAALEAALPTTVAAPNSAIVLIGTAGDLTPHDRDDILALTLSALSPEGTLLWGYYYDPRLKDRCEASVFLSQLSDAPDAAEGLTSP